jgi:hypothetical protein
MFSRPRLDPARAAALVHAVKDRSIPVSGSDRQSPNEDTAQEWATDSGTIRKGMAVIASDGRVLGTVERVEGEEILLAGTQGAFITLTLVDGVSEDAVLLQGRGDTTFGLGAEA